MGPIGGGLAALTSVLAPSAGASVVVVAAAAGAAGSSSDALTITKCLLKPRLLKFKNETLVLDEDAVVFEAETGRKPAAAADAMFMLHVDMASHFSLPLISCSYPDRKFEIGNINVVDERKKGSGFPGTGLQ